MIQINKIRLKESPFHIFLVPVFFILSKYVQYQGLSGTEVAIVVGLQLTLAIVFSWGLLYLVTRNATKSALIISFCALLFLFFGDIRVYLKDSLILNLFSKYKFLLPTLIFIFFLFLKAIKSDKMTRRTNIFFSFLLLVFTSIEIIKVFQLRYQLKLENPATELKFHDTIKQDLPDIYFLVPDCYPSSSYQKEILEVDNNSFDDSLRNLGFLVLNQSKSNYNRTAFSMLSTFNMSYPKIADTSRASGPREYMLALKQISKARLLQYLKKANYEFINLSIFDLADTKALRKQKFLSTTPREMFLSHTFWNYFSRDIYYAWFFKKANYKQNLNRQTNESLKQYNHKIIDTLLHNNFSSNKHPVFTYAHLNLPHFPYFYDENGKAYPPDSIYNEDMIVNKKRFAGYIRYTNKQLLQIINSIKSKTNNEAVIILQSDHGLSDINTSRKLDAFRNYSAFYFPDGDYSMLYDSMSNVNSFRIIINKYMNQSLPLIPDQTFYIGIR
ncbi:sulfatase-like hydrolase/transferase [Lacibacter sp. H407]|uniref:sulfatase-like hydrolase/transferase n=1 Tax=Lacibacter sp. H407 TaxID=3133423 RepID=UPI0030C530DF